MDARTSALGPRRFAWLGLLLCGAACGQALTIDESKLPDWVKRQAAMPYRVIIQSPTATPPATAPAAVRRPAAAPLSARKPAAAASTASSPAAIAVDPQDVAASAAEGATPIAAPSAPPASTDPEAALAAASPEAAEAAAAVAVAAAPALTLIRRVDPNVPSELLTALDGDTQVTVAFTVQPDGEVSDAQVIASTRSQLNRPVLRAIKSWRYAPIPQARQHSVNFAFVAP